MSATQAESKLSSSENVKAYKSWPENLIPQSAAAMLVELGTIFAAAESSPRRQRLCSRCRQYLDPRNSTAQCANVFCSGQCEQEFVRESLASLTLEDCIRMQTRLEMLLSGVREPAG